MVAAAHAGCVALVRHPDCSGQHRWSWPVYLHPVLKGHRPMKQTLKNLWQAYKEFAVYVGDFQARLLLTVFYFTVASPFGLLARLILDPLKIRKRPITSGWVKRPISDPEIKGAQQQF